MENQDQKPTISVRLDSNGLNAFLHISPPEPVELDEIMHALSLQGIVEGLDQEALERAAQTPGRDEILIASGKPPQNGDDARIEYMFLTNAKEIKPLELEGGKVDYRELTYIPIVNPGDVLARKIPHTDGEPGRSVQGKTIPPVPGKRIELSAGRNVQISEDKMQAIAKLAGQPLLDGHKICVNPQYVVNGDVDYSTGNITFHGSVVVNGSVLNGFIVKATGDIEVGGTVEGGRLEAGGKAVVKGGVRAHANIRAMGDIVVRFCDSNSQLLSKHDIIIQDSSVHCDLVAARRVQVTNDLIGGRIRAGELISAGDIGTATGCPTFLEIEHRKADDVIEQMKRQLGYLEEQLNDFARQAKELLAKRDPTLTGVLQKLTTQKISVQMRYNQIKTDLAEAEDDTLELAPPRLHIKGTINPGCTVTMNRACLPITHPRSNCTLKLVDGEIAG